MLVFVTLEMTKCKYFLITLYEVFSESLKIKMYWYVNGDKKIPVGCNYGHDGEINQQYGFVEKVGMGPPFIYNLWPLNH
jgi:hypothetical protein